MAEEILRSAGTFILQRLLAGLHFLLANHLPTWEYGLSFRQLQLFANHPIFTVKVTTAYLDVST